MLVGRQAGRKEGKINRALVLIQRVKCLRYFPILNYGIRDMEHYMDILIPNNPAEAGDIKIMTARSLIILSVYDVDV